jgi:hypothetical protein
MEKQLFLLDYLYDQLTFKEDIYYQLNGINTFIIPLYHYLSILIDTIHTLLIHF